jgi:hypothetical protein
MDNNLMNMIKEYVQVSQDTCNDLFEKVASLEAEIKSMQEREEGLRKTAAVKSEKASAVVDKLIKIGSFKEANRNAAITSLSEDLFLALDCLDKMASDSIERQSVVPVMGRSVPMMESAQTAVVNSEQVWKDGINNLSRYSR